MKQKDIAMLVLITSLSLIVSYFLGNALFGGESSRQAQVEKVQPITSEFTQPDAAIFNDDAINLTETIKIGDTTSTNPFTSGE